MRSIISVKHKESAGDSSPAPLNIETIVKINCRGSYRIFSFFSCTKVTLNHKTKPNNPVSPALNFVSNSLNSVSFGGILFQKVYFPELVHFEVHLFGGRF